jgi:hypothetical protein
VASRNTHHLSSVHLVGDFPIDENAAIFKLCDTELGDRLLFFPQGRPLQLAQKEVSSQATSLASHTAHAFQLFRRMKDEASLPRQARMSAAIWAPLYGPAADSVLAEKQTDTLVAEISDLPLSLSGLTSELGVQINIPFADVAELEEADGKLIAAEHLETTVVRLVNAVPRDAAVILHFSCREGANFKIASAHLDEMAALATSILKAVARPVELIHVPIPLKVPNEAFLSPLRKFVLPDPTRLCLGLIHLSDGFDGAMRRVEVARHHVSEFAVAARSGFASRSPDSLADFLQLHARVAEACVISN